MIEDHLTHEERIRLERISQANMRVRLDLATAKVIEAACEFENYIVNGASTCEKTIYCVLKINHKDQCEAGSKEA